jgi:integrase
MASAPADVSESALPGLLAWPIERTPAVVAASTSVTVSPTSTHSAATNAAGMGRLAEDEASGRRHYVGLGFHDLRRASATSLVAAGVDVKTAQTVLGHSDAQLTLDHYAQVVTEQQRAAADAMGARFIDGPPQGHAGRSRRRVIDRTR